jgi:hypothetical protein
MKRFNALIFLVALVLSAAVHANAQRSEVYTVTMVGVGGEEKRVTS